MAHGPRFMQGLSVRDQVSIVNGWYGARLFQLGGGTRIDRVRKRISIKAWTGLE